MKKYERPDAVVVDEVSEGVYAASGAEEEGNCWTVTAPSCQEWNGSHHVFEVKCVHSATVEHISKATTVTLTFSSPVKDVYSESDFEVTFSGLTATIVRTLHANAYKSGDVMTYKVWAQAADEATTKALSVIKATISCTKSVNVQGKGGDGN